MAKFLSLLTKSSIYFCRGLELREQDPFEGTLSRPDLDLCNALIKDEEFMQRYTGFPLEACRSRELREYLFDPQRRKQDGDNSAALIYINCWNMNEHESAFLWSVYAPPADGVAIKSTIGRLKESIKNDTRSICIGPIQYIDYDRDHIEPGNMFNPFFRKRRSFEPERELRACFLQSVEKPEDLRNAKAIYPSGQDVACDIRTLIERVCISPSAPAWYSDVVKDTVARLGADLLVTKSSISDPAIF
ncbi:hypothetical protein LPW26_20785 [Rhodopseudomonas sp. HC1]|nr:hypothetical protein [Rhodopseudomonas infernalis]